MSVDQIQRTPEQVIGEAVHGYACGCAEPWPTKANYEELSTAVTDALHEAGLCIVPQRDLFNAVQTSVKWRAALRRALWRMREAHGLLSPGMRAGTADAKSLLGLGINEGEKNDREIAASAASEPKQGASTADSETTT